MKKFVRKNIVKRKVYKRRAKIRSIKKRIKTVSKASTPHDFEGMLISHVKTDATLGGTTLPYLLFESSIPMRELAYRHGITIGRELFLRTGDVTASVMVDFLGRSDLRNALYNPLSRYVAVRSIGNDKHIPGLKGMSHNYEAGIISGYLSALSSKKIDVVENACVYSGDGFCKFQIDDVRNAKDNEFEINTAVAEAVEGNQNSMLSPSYSMLFMTPALIQSLSDAIVPHMIEAGRKIGKDTKYEDVESTLEKIVSFFDMKEGKVIKERRKISVVVKYKAYNSVDGFVGMSSALVEGFLETRGNGVGKERRLFSGNEYVLRFDLLR